MLNHVTKTYSLPKVTYPPLISNFQLSIQEEEARELSYTLARKSVYKTAEVVHLNNITIRTLKMVKLDGKWCHHYEVKIDWSKVMIKKESIQNQKSVQESVSKYKTKMSNKRKNKGKTS